MIEMRVGATLRHWREKRRILVGQFWPARMFLEIVQRYECGANSVPKHIDLACAGIAFENLASIRRLFAFYARPIISVR
jgi:hypothetical protein